MFRGPLTVTAGPDAVSWTVTSTDGITVSQDGAPVTGGVLAAGQEMDLTVSAPTGHGVLHFWVGTKVFTVVVSQDAGAPVLALPSAPISAARRMPSALRRFPTGTVIVLPI
jgi:hypothetical protein